jgi:hypothetical protein
MLAYIPYMDPMGKESKLMFSKYMMVSHDESTIFLV